MSRVDLYRICYDLFDFISDIIYINTCFNNQKFIKIIIIKILELIIIKYISFYKLYLHKITLESKINK